MQSLFFKITFIYGRMTGRQCLNLLTEDGADNQGFYIFTNIFKIVIKAFFI